MGERLHLVQQIGHPCSLVPSSLYMKCNKTIVTAIKSWPAAAISREGSGPLQRPSR